MTAPTIPGTDDPAWLAARRADASGRLDDLAMPSERDEIWRYLDLDFDPAFDSAPSQPGTVASPDELAEAWTGKIVSVIDGFVTDAGVSTVISASEPTDDGVGTDLFATAYDALAPGAVLIDGDHLGEKVFVDVQSTGAATTFPGVHVEVPAGSEASVVVRFRSASDVPAVVVPRLTANVGDNARLALTVIQDWNYQTRAMGRAVVNLGRDSGLTLSEVGLGAKIGRLHLDVNFIGHGSWAKIYGVYFGEDDQTLDYRYFMNHIGTNTRSDMFLKGAVEDDALSVFTGMIRIETTGVKTEAFQTNRNLILSSGASAQSVPNLEILANDVKCGHGSSVGPLDEDQRYYLMSRGLTPDVADRLQVRGFFEESISQIPHADLRPWIRERINMKYITAQEEGRV
ncbi:MAG: Fe-S cluster assembly protein SufD [Armatimonadetes bacterium]|nr:MAG: Fe-S cluster assembly protein SufD [Armatimonadota bacterium]